MNTTVKDRKTERKTDEQVMAEAVTLWQSTPAGKLITSGQARVIAANWHGGQMSALYSFASCGAILSDLADEITYEYRHAGSSPAELLALRDYVRAYGVRRPIPMWSEAGA